MPAQTWQAGRTAFRILSISPLPTGLVRLVRTFLQKLSRAGGGHTSEPQPSFMPPTCPPAPAAVIATPPVWDNPRKGSSLLRPGFAASLRNARQSGTVLHPPYLMRIVRLVRTF